MAIAATYTYAALATGGTSAVQNYTVPTTAPSYSRDLVLTNAGTITIWAGISTVGTVATSVASFQIPAGGSVVLTQCQVPTGAVVSSLSGQTLTGLLSIGYGSVVSVI